jgi:hypothetical protein
MSAAWDGHFGADDVDQVRFTKRSRQVFGHLCQTRGAFSDDVIG